MEKQQGMELMSTRVMLALWHVYNSLPLSLYGYHCARIRFNEYRAVCYKSGSTLRAVLDAGPCTCFVHFRDFVSSAVSLLAPGEHTVAEVR